MLDLNVEFIVLQNLTAITNDMILRDPPLNHTILESPGHKPPLALLSFLQYCLPRSSPPVTYEKLPNLLLVLFL